MFLLLHAFNSLASRRPIHTRSPSTALQRERKMSSLKCNTREYSGTNKIRLYFHMDRVHLPRCVHGPVAPAEARCPPRRPVAPTAMLETHSDAMLTTTRASPAMAVLALLDEIEDLLGSRQARSTTSSICRTVESNLCMHAVPVHLRQSRPSSKEAVPVRSGDRRSRSHPNKRRPSFDLLM